MRLLLVEDDKNQAQYLQALLQRQHYVVDWGEDCQTGLDFFALFRYDLILLDISLPDTCGIQCCQDLRQRGLQTPILLLTAHDTLDNRIQGLDAGADDYILKSAPETELLARIRALLRRPSQGFITPQLHWGQLTLDPNLQTVTVAGQLVVLSPREYTLVNLFLRHPQRIWSRDAILEHLWSWEDVPSEGTIRTHIKRLRQKLAPFGVGDLIETVYGIGYRLRASASPDDRASTAGQASSTHALSPTAPPCGCHPSAQNTLPHRCERGLQLGNTAIPPNRVQTHLEPLHWALTADCCPTCLAQTRPSPHRTVLWVDADLALVEPLHALAEQHGFRLNLIQTLETLQAAYQASPPDVMVLDCCLPDQPNCQQPLLTQFAPPWPAMPIVLYTHHDQLKYRIALQNQVHRYITKRIPIAQVFDQILDLLQSPPSTQPTVLAVDQEPETLQQLHQTLTSWGIHLHGLRDPRQFWETLQQLAPDVLLLATELPDYDGLQLCRIVRHAPQWQHLPILLLSPQPSASLMDALCQSGADDYLQKPLDLLQLKFRLHTHLRRRGQQVHPARRGEMPPITQ